MTEKSTPKGRGALLEMLRKHKEERAVGVEFEAAMEKIPPKSRGRAALLQKLTEMKEKKVGVGGEEPPSVPVAGPSSGTSKRDEPEILTKSISELSVASSSEPSYYKGQSGTPLRATANYIRLEVEKDRGVFEYEVRFQPDIDAKSNRIKLLNEALGELKTTKVYDGDACLYLPSQAIKDRQEVDGVIPNTNETVKTIIIYKRKKKMSECIHLYNVLFKRIMNILLYTRMGRNYFDTEHKHLIPQHKLEVLPGYAFAVDEMEDGLMLCLDTQHRVVRSQTVYELLLDIRATDPRNFKEVATKNIIGTCILTKYNNKNYIVDDIAWNMNPKDSFKTHGGSSCTFIDYYKHHYNITIQDVDQPLLINRRTTNVNGVKVENMVCLIPELSHATGLTDAMRSDFKVMKDVAVHTRITPHQRMIALRTYLRKVRESELSQKVLSGWGLKIAGGTTNVNARVLPQEAVYFGGPQSEERKIVSTDWNKALGDNKLTGPVDLITWQLYYTSRDQKYATTFADTVVRLAKGMGCLIRNPEHIVLKDDRTETYMTTVRDNISRSTNVQVAVFICPTIRADRYSIIKKLCCTQVPIASQVILSKTLSNQQKVRTITHKIAMQINCKLGGTLWSVRIPATNWMVVGIDVYHGANNQSVCGFVCSTNDGMTKWYSEALFQEREIGDFFKMAYRKALIERKSKHGLFPTKIIIFRDGVGDGQLEHCRRYELVQFEDVNREMNIDATITFVVVQKRINTRIFKMIDDTSCENPPAGTVVDSIITRRNLKDFFLVPQSVRQGTVNPTHYIVLHDDADIKPDHLERLAYKLCHLYYNWSGTIRVPAPCLYAHKLASLVGQYIKKSPSAELNDRLYYL